VASATDVVDGTVPVTCTPASGATFALGPTTVTCTATDAAGNTATGTFAVLVRDTTPPALSLSDGMDRYPVDAGISIKATATDIVSGSVAPTCKLKQEATGTVTTVPCSYAADAWSLGALGQYTFLASATDAAGKTAEASFTFRVAATYSSVSNLTKQWSSKATVAKDLVAILDSAFAAEQRRQFTAEANKLTDFRAGVKAQSGKAFDAGKAALLIAFSYGL